ncbi:MAG: hypothetical protein Q4P14_03165 [Methanobacteriaceae archaeon]|nr:hypothetical protein [Methanobacteriaceae archaeon]
MKNIYKVIIIVLAICGIAFVAYSSFMLVQEDQDLLTYGDDFSIYSTNKSIELKDNVDVSRDLNITKGSYYLIIDSNAKWKISYSIDGNSYLKEGNGKEKINLGTIASSVKINYNQLTNGSSDLQVYDSNNKFIASVYQEGKTVNIHYNLNVA